MEKGMNTKQKVKQMNEVRMEEEERKVKERKE